MAQYEEFTIDQGADVAIELHLVDKNDAKKNLNEAEIGVYQLISTLTKIPVNDFYFFEVKLIKSISKIVSPLTRIKSLTLDFNLNRAPPVPINFFSLRQIIFVKLKVLL